MLPLELFKDFGYISGDFEIDWFLNIILLLFDDS
jgi:hypothetical protein